MSQAEAGGTPALRKSCNIDNLFGLKETHALDVPCFELRRHSYEINYSHSHVVSLAGTFHAVHHPVGGTDRVAGPVSGVSQRNTGYATARDRWIRLRPAGSDDSHAGRSEVAHGDSCAEGSEGRADPADANALRCQCAHYARS